MSNLCPFHCSTYLPQIGKDYPSDEKIRSLSCTASNLHCPLYTGCGGPKIFTSYILYIVTISISHPNRKKAILTIVVANALY